MDNEERKDVEFTIEAMGLLQEAKEFCLSVLVEDKEQPGAMRTVQRVTDMKLIPYFLDMWEEGYRRQIKRLNDQIDEDNSDED